MTGVLLQLLAADPRTPGPTLAWLAGRHDLTVRDVFTLAGHAHLPPSAPLTAPTPGRRTLGTARALAAVLTNNLLPPARRAELLALLPAAVVTAAIADGAPLTTAEVASQHAAHPPTTSLEQRGYLSHPSTPRHLAVAAIEALSTHDVDTRHTVEYALLLEAATVRHNSHVTTARARAALTSPDPARAYARALLEEGPPTKYRWSSWASALLEAHPHSDVIAALLAGTRDRHDPNDTAGSNHNAAARTASRIYATQTIPLTDRHAALAFTGEADSYRGVAARTAPDHVIAAIATSRSVRLNALTSPHASAAMLTTLYRHLTTADGEEPELPAAPCEALAAHPNLASDLRAELAAHDHHPHALSRRLHTNGTTPEALLALPYQLLRSAGAPASAAHWATTAYRAYPHAHTVTVGQAHALLALDTGAFPGTFRELLDTARAIST